MARILFIDDDPLTLETFMRAVQLFGSEAILAASGEQGLTLAREQSPDLIFVDMRLPDLDGLNVVRKLTQEPGTAHIPVLVLSAGPEIDVADQAREAGAKDYLSKPVRLQALQDIVRQYTGE